MTEATNTVGAQLRAYVERIERLNEEAKTIRDDVNDVYAEAKGNGFDVKAMRKIVSERKQSAADRVEQEVILDTYRAALGMLADTPLGQAAVTRATAERSPQRRRRTREMEPA